MTRQMSAGSQIAFTNAWLERQGIEAQTIDVEGYVDPSLSYEENIKLFKQRFKLGGGRSRQRATRDLSAAECDVAIGNYKAGFNHEVTVDACACGHPDACVDLEREGRAAKAAAAPKPKVKKLKCDWWKIPRDQWVDGHIRSPAMHWECVRQALAKGYKVPAKVLKDYPDLVKKQEAAAPKRRQPAAKPAKAKYKVGDLVYSYQNPKIKRPIRLVREPIGADEIPSYIISLKHEGGGTQDSNWIDEPSISKTPQREVYTPPRTPAPRIPAILAPAPAPTPLPDVPLGLGGGGIPAIPGVGAAAKRRQPAKKPAAKPAKAKAKKTAAPKPKPPKKAAKPKNGKAKKPAAGIELTAAQRKRLAAEGSIMIKRGGKFVTVRG